MAVETRNNSSSGPRLGAVLLRTVGNSARAVGRGLSSAFMAFRRLLGHVPEADLDDLSRVSARAADTHMPAQAEDDSEDAAPPREGGLRARLLQGMRRLLSSSLTRRIVFLNAAALFLLASGILYLNQFRAGLIDARVQSLLTQGEIIAGAIASSASIDTESITIDADRLLDLQPGETISPVEDDSSLEFPINPERAAPILRRLVLPTKSWARIYDTDGELIVDSRNLAARGQILSFDLPVNEPEAPGFFTALWDRAVALLFSSDLPLLDESLSTNGRSFPEVVAALNGASVSIVRANEKHELIVSVSVPVQRFRAILGALVLSTQGGDIDAIVHAERWAILRVFLVALAVTVLLSILLAGTIAEPMRRLARAAERVRVGSNKRVEIPDFSARGDEIGHLSTALRDMTNALYNRIDAIESFAADVAHELKNPLTSLRSAVETLPLARDDEARERLVAIVQDDVKRLDRLISDISDASRLDAELARAEAGPVDIAELLDAVVAISTETRKWNDPRYRLTIDRTGGGARDFVVDGHDSRLGQVIRNLLANARSFSPANGEVVVHARRLGDNIEIRVEDDGPGIRPENLSKIFDRFHTDRPGADQFGKNSGLGLSISRQIVEAHGGRIWAENRHGDRDRHLPGAHREVLGARFVVSLPSADGNRAKPRESEDTGDYATLGDRSRGWMRRAWGLVRSTFGRIPFGRAVDAVRRFVNPHGHD